MFCHRQQVLDFSMGCGFFQDRKCVVVKLWPIYLIFQSHLSALVTT
jgi:hypothetical protein